MLSRRIAALVLITLVVSGTPGRAQVPARAHEPVVASVNVGNRVVSVDDVVAFRWTQQGWRQVPVQIDEQEMVTIGTSYNDIVGDDCGRAYDKPLWCTWLTDRVDTLYYVDESTYLLPKGDGLLGTQDEIAFMSKDAGPRAPAGQTLPDGTMGNKGVEIRVRDLLYGGDRYAYLFLRAPGGGLSPDADTAYVAYDFVLCDRTQSDCGRQIVPDYDYVGQSADTGPDGDYKLGSNPEDTWVETGTYRAHFSDRWIQDSLIVVPENPAGLDLIDRRKTFNKPDVCGRTEYTGSRSEGTFVVNRSGPIRVIRSIMGFNSGPLLQREDIFYEQYSTTTFYYRIHATEGFLEAYDFDTGLAGQLRYYDDGNPVSSGGDLIDGQGGIGGVGERLLSWSAVQGAPGTLVSTFSLTSNVTQLYPSVYYEDNAVDPQRMCTGDAYSYGLSGFWINDRIPNTDPRQAEAYGWPLNSVMIQRFNLYQAGSVDLQPTVDAFVAEQAAPLKATTRMFYGTRNQAALAFAHEGLVLAGSDVAADAGRDGADLPVAITLQGAYPNPFRDGTTLAFELPAPGDVRLAVYDMLGREVATLADGPHDTGRHEVRLDAADLPSGVYVARLTAGGVRASTLLTRLR